MCAVDVGLDCGELCPTCVPCVIHLSLGIQLALPCPWGGNSFNTEVLGESNVCGWGGREEQPTEMEEVGSNADLDTNCCPVTAHTQIISSP